MLLNPLNEDVSYVLHTFSWPLHWLMTDLSFLQNLLHSWNLQGEDDLDLFAVAEHFGAASFATAAFAAAAVVAAPLPSFVVPEFHFKKKTLSLTKISNQ